MDIPTAVLNEVRKEANNMTIQAIEEGRIDLDDEVLPPFLAANLIANPQIIDVLKAVNGLIMENMEKEYVDFFLEKVREIANKERCF